MPRTYRRKRFYTTAQRILVHLSPQGHAEPPGPDAFTQDGIAAGIRSGRSTVTKWLARLEARGLLAHDRIHLDGYLLPKIVYRLTPAGAREAEGLVARLSKDVVEVQTPSLGTLRVRTAELPKLVPPTLDLTDSMSLVRSGRLDLAAEGVPPSRVEPVVWGESLRRVDRLFGREWELRFLDGWAGSPSRVLLVTGLAGIGKSALVAAWLERREPRTHVFGVELRRTTRVRAFLSELAEFLGRLGRRGLESHLAQEGAPDLAFVGRLLAKELKTLPVLVVLDSVDQAGPDVARLVGRHLLPLAEATPTRILLLARHAPKWIGPATPDSSLQVLRLHGLDAEASLGILRYKGLTADDATARSVAASTRGHPLLLHLVAQGTGPSTPVVERYLEDEVWRKLSPRERKTLQLAAVLRRAVPARILRSAAGVQGPVIENLQARNLLEQTVTGGYVVHDVIRDFITSRLGPTRLRALHERAARPLLTEPEARDRWEGVYHLFAAERADEAAAFLDSSGAPLLDSVAAEEIASLARSLPLDRMAPATACVCSEILAGSLQKLGHVGPALYQYNYAVQVAERHGKLERVPRLLRKMASIERYRARYPKALGYLVEARARLARVPDPAEQAEVLREMALVEQALGDFPAAAAHFNEAIDLATEQSDPASLARAFLALGSLETQRGHRDRGIEYNQEGLRIAERSGNLTETARGHIVVGTGLAELGRLAESLGHFEKGLELARVLGNLRLMAYATMNRTAILLDLGRHEQAGAPLQEAKGYFEILEERDTLALLKIYEGNREERLGRWQRAERLWDEGLMELRSVGTPTDLVRVLKDVGTYKAGHGEAEEGLAQLEEALGVARKLGNATLLAEIEERIHSLKAATITNKGS